MEDLEAPALRYVKEVAGLGSTTASELVHMAEGAGGLGWNSWWDRLMMDRMVILDKALHADGAVSMLAMNAISRLRGRTCSESPLDDASLAAWDGAHYSLEHLAPGLAGEERMGLRAGWAIGVVTTRTASN